MAMDTNNGWENTRDVMRQRDLCCLESASHFIQLTASDLISPLPFSLGPLTAPLLCVVVYVYFSLTTGQESGLFVNAK